MPRVALTEPYPPPPGSTPELRLTPGLSPRAGGVQAEVPPLLDLLCPAVPDLGVLPLVAVGEAVGEVHGDGPLPGPGHHHLHRAQHPVHGPGALPHDGRVQRHALRRQPGPSLP